MNRKQRRAGAIQTQSMQKTASEAVMELFAVAAQYLKAGKSNQAVACFRHAIKISPDFAAAHYNLGNALGEQGQNDEAIICFRRTIQLAPGFAGAHTNLGATLKRQGQLSEAAACCQKAIDLNPNFALGHFNLGTVLEEQRQLEEAVTCYRNAIRHQPDFAVAHHNLAMLLLALGDMPVGWQEYEWRWRTGQVNLALPNFQQPRWRGGGVEKTLLIHAEQGFGDTLQFCRYAPLVNARGLRVIMGSKTTCPIASNSARR